MSTKEQITRSNPEQFSAYVKQREADSEREQKKIKSQIDTFYILSWLAIGLGVLVGIFAVLDYIDCCSQIKLNELGDYLAGTMAALFSLAGVFLVYIAFLGQKLSLEVQAIELLYSQLEAMHTREEISGQKEQLKIQGFESSLFSLIDVYNDVMNSFSDTKSGKIFFKEVAKEIRKRYNQPIHFQFNSLGNHEAPFGTFTYERYYIDKKDEISHYLRLLYRIFKFIDEYKNDEVEGLSEEEIEKVERKKWEYAKLVRSQLSEGELFVLYYNAFTKNGERFKKLIYKYNVTKHLPIADKLEVEMYYRTSFNATENGKDFMTPKYLNTKQRKTMYLLITRIDKLIEDAINNRGTKQISLLAYNQHNDVVEMEAENTPLQIVINNEKVERDSITITFKLGHLAFKEESKRSFMDVFDMPEESRSNLLNLFDAILLSKFYFNNFGLYNGPKDFDFGSGMSDENNQSEVNTIWVRLTRSDEKPVEFYKDKY